MTFFEEVIERDRVFGSLLRKIKTAYDMLLLRAPAVPPLPMDGSSMAHHGHTHEAMDQHTWGQDNRGHSGLHSNETTTRAEGGQAWEMQRENRVLKDLVERLHLELEEAVRREHRWKQKVTKLKARVDGSDSRQASPPQAPGLYGKVADDWLGGHAGGHPDFHSQAGHPPAEDRGLHDDLKRAANGGVPKFHANRREPTLGDTDGQDGPLNQGGLLSLSSISPTASVPPLPESFNAESARSTDSGMLPQRPPRRQVVKPAHVPQLDLSKLKDQLDDEDEEEEEMEMAGGPDEHGFDDDDLDEMQAHGKIVREHLMQGEYDDGDEDPCWPSFDHAGHNFRDPGHMGHPPMKAAGKITRPQNPVGYDDDDDDDMLPEGLSRHSH